MSGWELTPLPLLYFTRGPPSAAPRAGRPARPRMRQVATRGPSPPGPVGPQALPRQWHGMRVAWSGGVTATGAGAVTIAPGDSEGSCQ
jgi:hypothetical protein